MDNLPAPGLSPDPLDQPEIETPPADPSVLAAQESPVQAGRAMDGPADEPGGRLNRLRRVIDPRGRIGLADDSRRRWRRRATALILAIALILGFGGAAPLTYGPTPSGSGSPVAASSGGASSSPTNVPVTEPPSSEAASASASPTESLPVVAIPSPTSRTATIAFVSMMLDSTTDAASSPRRFTFVSDGPGIVSAHIVTTSPTETTRMCIAADGAPPECASNATPGFTKPVLTAHSKWTVTLASANEGTPTVDVALSWPTDHPSIQFEGGRFQGAPNPDSLRSLTAAFKTGAAGQLSLTAAWPPATVATTLTLADTSGAQPVAIDTVNYPAAGSIVSGYSHAVAAGRAYTVTLFDAGPDKARPSLSATIAFP